MIKNNRITGFRSGTFALRLFRVSTVLDRSDWNLELLVSEKGAKTAELRENPLEQGWKPTTNSTHIDNQSNSGCSSERRVRPDADRPTVFITSFTVFRDENIKVLNVIGVSDKLDVLAFPHGFFKISFIVWPRISKKYAFSSQIFHFWLEVLFAKPNTSVWETSAKHETNHILLELNDSFCKQLAYIHLILIKITYQFSWLR